MRTASPAKNLKIAPARAGLADAVGQRLALLARQQPAELLLARQDLGAGAIEDVESLLRVRPRPLRERLPRRRDRLLDVGRGPARELADDVVKFEGLMSGVRSAESTERPSIRLGNAVGMPAIISARAGLGKRASGGSEGPASSNVAEPPPSLRPATSRSCTSRRRVKEANEPRLTPHRVQERITFEPRITGEPGGGCLLEPLETLIGVTELCDSHAKALSHVMIHIRISQSTSPRLMSTRGLYLRTAVDSLNRGSRRPEARPSRSSHIGQMPGAGWEDVAEAKPRVTMEPVSEDHNTRILVIGDDGAAARYVAEALAREAFHNVSYFAGPFTTAFKSLTQ